MKPSDAFIDEITLTVRAGAGGDGYVGFRRARFEPRGGPDGGDGGRGGNVIVIADPNLATLRDYRYRRELAAERGIDGQGNKCKGADGADVILRVPVGTVVRDQSADPEGPPLVDLVEAGQQFYLARGGRGGWGNSHFATPTRQSPDFAKPGLPGEKRGVLISLKLIADVGLIGLPNAGKSTLLSRLSAARPRVAAYPFTTLVPSLGVVEYAERRFVVADVPGLIEGASEGHGLGDRFLRHVERTRVLVHLLDAGNAVLHERDLIADYDTIRHELGAYNTSLTDREEIVVLNKTDLIADGQALDAVEATLRSRGQQVLRLSGVTGQGVAELVPALLRAIDAALEREQKLRQEQGEEAAP